ncbi:unnamed protein product, partial [Closterium sp. Yama58-4]
MPAEEPDPPHGARNGLSVLGVLPRLSENYAVPIAQPPPREPSPEVVVGTVYPFEPPGSPTAWEPHPDIELVPGGSEGSSKPPTASPSTVSTAPVKRPRVGTTYKQQTLWGAPPPRNATPHKRSAPSADPKPPTALADAEYELVDITLVAHIVQQTRLRLKTRYSLRDPTHHFGSGEKMQLPEFIKSHGKTDKREMKAEGVDGDGNPMTFEFKLHELPLPGHETGGDVTACVELAIKYVRAIDKELEWRMRDLELLEGSKLFRTASYMTDDTKRSHSTAVHGPSADYPPVRDPPPRHFSAWSKRRLSAAPTAAPDVLSHGGPAPGESGRGPSSHASNVARSLATNARRLQRQLRRLAVRHGRHLHLGVAVVHVPSGQAAIVRAAQQFPLASVAKLPLLFAAAHALHCPCPCHSTHHHHAPPAPFASCSSGSSNEWPPCKVPFPLAPLHASLPPPRRCSVPLMPCVTTPPVAMGSAAAVAEEHAAGARGGQVHWQWPHALPAQVRAAAPPSSFAPSSLHLATCMGRVASMAHASAATAHSHPVTPAIRCTSSIYSTHVAHPLALAPLCAPLSHPHLPNAPLLQLILPYHHHAHYCMC